MRPATQLLVVHLPAAAPAPRRGGLLDGILAHLRWRALEQRLMDGADPASDPLLARRAAQLTRRSEREALAGGLAGVLSHAREPACWAYTSAVPVCRDEVLIAEPALLALIRRLRDGRPVAAAGVARVRAMLMDGSSPLYVGGEPGVVRRWARAVLDELTE